MVNIRLNFKRVGEAFDDMTKGRILSDSISGSDTSGDDSLPNLDDHVNSFLEKHILIRENVYRNEEVFIIDEEKEEEQENGLSTSFEREIKEELMKLLRTKEDDGVKKHIHAVVEKACLEVGDLSPSPASFKRRLIALLRENGLDAGMCKSKWEKSSNCPSGSYEYIDVVSNSRRFIIEVSLASQFEIARSTDSYLSLLQYFPQIFVGELQEIKKTARLMCNSIKTSMKESGISIPPWRRVAYMQAKWIGPYKRTIEYEVPKASKALDEDLAMMRSTGFVAVKTQISYSREDVARAC